MSSLNFQLLIYKFKVEPKKRNEFTDDMFYTFLQNNYNIELFKQLMSLFPNIIESNNKSKVIENCCLLKCGISGNDGTNNKEKLILNMIKYIILELGIEPTPVSIDNASSKGNVKLLEYFIEIGYLNLGEKKQIDYGLVHCALNSRNFKFFEYLLKECPINWAICRNEDILSKLVDTGDVRFIKHSLENKQLDEDNINSNPTQFLLEVAKNGTFEIIKYIFGQNPVYKNIFEKYPIQITARILLRITSRNDINLLKYFIEDLKADREIMLTYNILSEYCRLGNLECCKYLYEKFPNLSFKTDCMDFCLFYNHSTTSNELFNWLLKVSPVGCSFYGLRYCANRIKTHKLEMNQILSKFRSNFTNDQILRLIVTDSNYCENIDNFSYLSSFLPKEMVPSFPVEEIDDYNFNIYEN